MSRGEKILLIILVAACLFFSLAQADEIRYDSGGRRDPFVPLMGPEGMSPGMGGEGLLVDGIVFDPRGDSYAIISDEIYREGEEVQGSKLVKIFPDRVVFLQASDEVVIWLREEVVRAQQDINE